MAKKRKNLARFMGGELNLLNGFIFWLAIKLHDFVQNYNDPAKYGKDLAGILKSDKGLALSTIFFAINNMNSDQPFFPENIKEKLAKTLSEESQHDLTSPDLSKVLKSLKNAGLFLNPRGKKN